MSIATNSSQSPDQERVVYDCAAPNCSDTRTCGSTVGGSYCSRECYERVQGRRLLKSLRDDHRYCYTCFRRLKEIDEPSDEWRDRKQTPFDIALDQGAIFERDPDGKVVLDASSCEHKQAIDPDIVIGFEAWTEHASRGEVSDGRPSGVPDDTRMGLVCECGQTHHADRDDVLRTADIKSVVRNLYNALEECRLEGQHDKHIDLQTLIGVLREQVQSGEAWDFPRAVGAAIVEDGDS